MSKFNNTPAYLLALKLINAAKNFPKYNFSVLDLKNIWRHLCVEGINLKSTNYGLGLRKVGGNFQRYDTGLEVLDTIYNINKTHPGLLGAKDSATYGKNLEFSPHGSYCGLKDRLAYVDKYASNNYPTMDGVFEEALSESQYIPKELVKKSPIFTSNYDLIIAEPDATKIAKNPLVLNIKMPSASIKFNKRGSKLLKRTNTSNNLSIGKFQK